VSLTSFVALPDVKAKLRQLHPTLPRRLPVPIRVNPTSDRFALLGTAFDYLLRFEIQRRSPQAEASRWVAEAAPEIVWRQIGSASVGLDLLLDADPTRYLPPATVAARMRAILTAAAAAVAAHATRTAPGAGDLADLAAHAIRLAKLDSVFRAGRLEPGFEEAVAGDVDELVALLGIVPFDDFPLRELPVLLNPDFGRTSGLVGGADADLIAGDLLTDFKTTKKGEIEVGNLDQVLGYLLLARKQRSADPAFPEVRRLGLYFCRHGYLWTASASDWTGHPAFAAVEGWFWERAGQLRVTPGGAV